MLGSFRARSGFPLEQPLCQGRGLANDGRATCCLEQVEGVTGRGCPGLRYARLTSFAGDNVMGRHSSYMRRVIRPPPPTVYDEVQEGLIMVHTCGCRARQTLTGEARPNGPISAQDRVGEVVRDHPAALEVLKEEGINHCCGAQLTLSEAAAATGVDIARLLTVLNAVAITETES